MARGEDTAKIASMAQGEQNVCAQAKATATGEMTSQVELERSTLATMIAQGNDADDIIAKLPPEALLVDAYRQIYDAMRELRQERQPIDVVTLTARLELSGALETLQVDRLQGEAVITDLRSTPFVNVDAYVKLLLDAWKLRRFRALLASAAQSNDADIVERTAMRLGEIEVSQNERLERLGSVVARVLGQLDTQTAPPGISTFLAPMDVALGSLRFGDLTIIAARPGIGKTALVTHVCTHAAEADVPVLFFSCEMSRDQLSTRICSQRAEINIRKVLDNAHDRDERRKLWEVQKQLQPHPFFVDDTPAVRLSHVRAMIRKVNRELSVAKTRLRLVVVDYIQLMTGDDTETRDQEIGTITRGLKEIAKEFDVHIIALSQLNRQVEARADKRPVMSDLRESGNIEQDADNIVFIYRDERYNRQTRMKGIAELIIAKQRNGPEGGVFYVGFEGDLTKFYDLTDSQLLAAGLSKQT